MKVLVDTNVALDLLMAREPFLADALQLFALAEADRVELLLSTDALSTIFYIVEKNRNAAVARSALLTVLDFVQLVHLDESAAMRGLALDFIDIEDAFVAAVADATQADVIVTRNVKDFKNSPVTVMAPREFLAFWTSIGQANHTN